MDCVISVFFHVATLFLTIRRTDTGVPLSLSRVLRYNGQKGRVDKFDAVSFYLLDGTLTLATMSSTSQLVYVKI